MVECLVLEDIAIKTPVGRHEIKRGLVIRLQEEPARILMQKGKVKPVADLKQDNLDGLMSFFEEKGKSEPGDKPKPTIKPYELSERDRELERYIGKPHMNPSGYPCARCGAVAGRYCLGQKTEGRWWWAWWCLKCYPYNEPKLN